MIAAEKRHHVAASTNTKGQSNLKSRSLGKCALAFTGSVHNNYGLVDEGQFLGGS